MEEVEARDRVHSHAPSLQHEDCIITTIVQLLNTSLRSCSAFYPSFDLSCSPAAAALECAPKANVLPNDEGGKPVDPVDGEVPLPPKLMGAEPKLKAPGWATPLVLAKLAPNVDGLPVGVAVDE